LLKGKKFLSKAEFTRKGFLGSGGIGRFRDTLWAAASGNTKVSRLHPETRAEFANKHRQQVQAQLATP